MKKIIFLLCASLLLNFSNADAQDNTVPSTPPPVEMQVDPMPQPDNSGMPSPSALPQEPVEMVPVLTVPVETMPAEMVPAPDGDEDVIIDSHLIIEDVAAPAAKPAPGVYRNTFARIKQLAGRWEGSGAGKEMATPSGEGQEKVVVTYEVTAGGYAVLERIFPGTSQEMVTMYFEQNGQLTLMHFCLIGTRSMMVLDPVAADIKPGEETAFVFNLAENSVLDPDVETHMHSLKISFVDTQRIKQEWVMFEAGKQSGAYSFNLTRVPTANAPEAAAAAATTN